MVLEPKSPATQIIALIYVAAIVCCLLSVYRPSMEVRDRKERKKEKRKEKKEAKKKKKKTKKKYIKKICLVLRLSPFGNARQRQTESAVVR